MFMKIWILTLNTIVFLSTINFIQPAWASGSCPANIDKEWMLGKVGKPSKFYTPVKTQCDDATLNVFTNCIQTQDSQQLYFGSLQRFEEIKSAQCPFGYAPKVANGFFGYQRYDDKRVCLDPCNSISVGKFFRDEQRFGERRALNIGDVVFVPELKGKKCGTSTHDGCAIVTQFIEYTNEPVLDFYSGTCKNIHRGLCLDYKDERLPSKVTLFKLSPEEAKVFKDQHQFPGISSENLNLVIRTPATKKF